MSGKDYLQYRIAEQMRVLVTDSPDSIDRLFALGRGSPQNPSAAYERLQSQYTDRSGNDLRSYRDNYKLGRPQNRVFDLDALERSLPRNQGSLPDHQWRLIESLREDIHNLRNYSALPQSTRDALGEADRRMMDPRVNDAEKARLRHFIHADGATISAEGLLRSPPEPRRTTLERAPAGPQEQRVWSASLNQETAMVHASLDASTMPADERNRIIRVLNESGFQANFEPSARNRPAAIRVTVNPDDAHRFHATIESLRSVTDRATGSHQINPQHWKPIQEFIGPPSAHAASPHAPHRPGRVGGGVVVAGALALGAGAAAAATGASPQASGHVAAETAASNIPGVSGRLAPNRREAAIRDAADAFGLVMSAAGAWVGGAGGSVVPVAGNAAGAVSGGIIGNLIGTMGAEEVLRLYARYVEGHKDDVEPSTGERLVMAAIQSGALSIARLKPYIEEAANKVREYQGKKAKTYTPASSGTTRRGVDEEEHPDWISQEFILQMKELERNPLTPETISDPTVPQGESTARNVNHDLPSIAEGIRPYVLNFNLGPVSMEKYVGQLREGQALPDDLKFAIEANGRQFLEIVQTLSSGVDIRKTQEFQHFFAEGEPATPAKMGAILFALSLKPDANGQLQFSNQLKLSELATEINTADLELRRAIARNAERGVFGAGHQSETKSLSPTRFLSGDELANGLEHLSKPNAGSIIATPNR